MNDALGFEAMYERYLSTVYDRRALVDSIAHQIRLRRSTTVLDCAAGTGHPALDLLVHHRGIRVHCSDADDGMLGKLRQRALCLGINPYRLSPKLNAVPEQDDTMAWAWNHLDQIDQHYEYVMCRGNSLVYATTWADGTTEAATLAFIEEQVVKIADRVESGGYLHVDAPRVLADWQPEPLLKDGLKIFERVDLDETNNHREWTVTMEAEGEDPYEFVRYSSLCSIGDIGAMLEKLGFDELDPVDLEGERPGFGVIIARKSE